MNVNLPTIIIFERHWDLIPKQVIQAILPAFVKEGYDTLCLEAPSSLNREEITFRLQKAVEFDSTIFSQTTTLLTRANAMPAGKLEDLGFETLSRLMQYYVSSQRFTEVAEKIKNLPAAKLFQQILSTISDLSITLKGVDVEEAIYAKVTSGNLENRVAAIEAAEQIRITSFVENLLKVRKDMHGTIFVCGASHISNLLTKFKERNVEGEFLCYFPHSSKIYGDTLNDIEIFKKIYPELKERSFCLSTAEEVHLFAQKILTEVKSKKTRNEN